MRGKNNTKYIIVKELQAHVKFLSLASYCFTFQQAFKIHSKLCYNQDILNLSGAQISMKSFDSFLKTSWKFFLPQSCITSFRYWRSGLNYSIAKCHVVLVNLLIHVLWEQKENCNGMTSV